MRSTILILFIICFVAFCNAFSEYKGVEARGKKKKIALSLFYVAELVVKKIFFLKLIYAFVFWLIIHKAGYLLTWFVSYLKEKKENYHSHGHDHDHEHYWPHHYDNPSYGPPSYGASYGPPSHGPSYGPYKRRN